MVIQIKSAKIIRLKILYLEEARGILRGAVHLSSSRE